MNNKLLDWLYDETRHVPNQFTEAVGRLIKNARIEAKMSQEELAEKTYLKQSSISKIENGTKGFYAEDLIYLSIALEKPILYFFPEKFKTLLENAESADKTIEEELLIHARKMSRGDLRKLIAQARALAELSDEDEPEPKKSPKHQEEFKKLVEQAAKKKNKVS